MRIEGVAVPKGKKKVVKISTVKKKLDAVFSKYIRTLHSKDGLVRCYTCPKVAPIAEMQNGHFVPRQYLAVRYDERNCRPQCYACNMLYNGQPSAYAKRLEEETSGIVRELESLRLVTTKWYPQDYLNKIEEYEIRLRNLQETM